jgi:hypothetical protein
LNQAHVKAGARAPDTPINWRNVIVWLSVGILIGTEVFAAALAAAWAAGGLMELGPALQYGLYAVAFAAAAAIMIPFMRRAALVDPLRGSQGEERP